MRMLLAILLNLAMAGCATSGITQPNLIQSLVGRCGLKGQIEFEREDDTHVAVSRLDPNADYDRAKCVLNGLEARGIDVGFMVPEPIDD